MSQDNSYDSEDDDLPELDSVSSSEYEERLELREDDSGNGKDKKEDELKEKISDDATVQEIKQTLELLDGTGDSNKQSSWMDSIDIQQYNGVAVVTIPGSAAAAALNRPEYAGRWLKYAGKRFSALKAYLLSPFLYGHAHQSDKWLDWCSYGKLLKSSSNYNTQSLSDLELFVVEVMETAANECLEMLDDDRANIKNKMEDIYNQAEKVQSFYQMMRIVEDTEWLRLFAKRIVPTNADEKLKEALQPNGFNAVAVCTIMHVYEYEFGRSDQPDFLEEFIDQCTNDEKDSEQMKLKGNELFQASKFDEAIECYSEAITIFPYNVFLYSNRAACYLRIKNFTAALSDGYRAIVLRRGWSKGYSRYIEALACGDEYKKAYKLCSELIDKKFSDVSDADQLRAALQKGRQGSSTKSSTKKASTAKPTTVESASKPEEKSAEVQETETRPAASTSTPSSQSMSKKLAAIAAKRQEKRESAKEARIASKEASKEEAKESSSAKDDVSVNAPKPSMTTATRAAKIIDLRKDPTKERPPMTAKNTKVMTAFVKPGKTPSANKILGMVPGSPVTWEDKAKLMHQQGVTPPKYNSNATTSNTNTSSTRSVTSSPVKEKDKAVKEKDKVKKETESKLSKSDHKLKKNVMFNLSHASKSLLEHNYRNAIKLYEMAMKEIEQQKTQWHSIMSTLEHNKLMVTIHYSLGTAIWQQRREDYVVQAMYHFRTITTRYSSVLFPPAYYYLGKANAALHFYIEALKDIHNGLNHIMRSRFLTTFTYPGLQEVIEDSLLHNIENKLRQLKHRCSPKIFADAVCRYSNCLQHHISTDIVRDDPEFKGYVSLCCTERCVVAFHSLCWRRLREDSVDHQNDKEYLGEVCITEGCSGVTKLIKHYEAVGRPKIIAQADQPLEVNEKKEPHNPKANRTKPSSTKKLQKIIHRRQEKVAEWHQKKEREALNTQSSKESCEDSVATPLDESVEEWRNGKVDTPDQGEVDVTDVGDMRKGGFEVHGGLEVVHSSKDETESKLKNKAKKRKIKQREKEVVLTGFTIVEHSGISASADIDESGNVQKQEQPKSPWNKEAPFSVPPHLRDQHDTFEELQGGGATVPTNQNAAAIASVWGTSINKAEADNLLSYFVEIMDKHGPMEIDDERLSGQLAILPENSQTLITNFGGLEKFLLSSTAFVKQEGLICLAEYAAVVAASMNSSGGDQDMLVAASSGNNFKSREMMIKDTHGMNYGSTPMGYSLKQKGLNKVGKDPIYGASKQPGNSTGVSPSKTPYSINSNNTKYEKSTKKNTAFPQSQSLVTPTLGGMNDPMMTSGKSTHSDKLSHYNQGAGKHASTKYQSVSSSLDPIETPLAFSSTIDRRISGISSSASTEHSQEAPSIEDEIIGNLFDYNNFGTGSSNYLSPSTDGFFPNAYPNEQGDSTMLPDIATATADTETFNKTGKKTGAVVNEMVVSPDVMSSAKSMKMMNSTTSYTSGENATNFDSTIGSLGNSSTRHMEPVYLPPPPVQKATDKKNATVMTDQVYIYSENYKEKYETEVRGRNELLKRLEDTEDRRVQMSNAHAMELDRAVKQTRNDATMECQKEIQSYKDQMREENNKMIAERKEHQEALKAMRNEIKSLNERSDKLRKELQAKAAEAQNQFMRFQEDLENAHREKKKAEDRLKVATESQQSSLQRAVDAEIQMLTMLREFTVKEVDRRIVECDNICVRLPPNSEAHKEWTSYKDNMKTTVEQYKTSVESHMEEVKRGKALSVLGPLKITPPQPPPLPFAQMPPPTAPQAPPPSAAQAPPPAAAATTPMYQMMPPQQQMTQGQNIRPPQPPVSMQTGYPIRPPYHMGQPGLMGHPQQQQWTGLVEQAQIPTQQPMMQDMAQQQFQQHPEGQNEMMAAGTAMGNGQQQANNSDGSVTKAQSSFDRIVERLSVEYPNYTKEEFKSVLKQVREQQGKLSNRSMDYIIQHMRDVINAKENTMTPTLGHVPAVTSQQQLPVSSSSLPATSSDSSTLTSGMAGKTVAATKKQMTEKVTVRTLPKKQGLRPPYISPPRKPNLNPLYLPAYEDDNECIICQEDMKDNNAVKLQCGHRFHKACIHSWFKEQSTCPTCRRHVLLPEEYPVLGQ